MIVTKRQLTALLPTLEDSKLYKVEEHKEKRSLNANGLMWHCLNEIATALNTDKWSVYLQELRKYGQFTYVLCKPSAVEKMKQSWREIEEVGEVDVNGQRSIQMLCYYGSHMYNTKEFSRLLDGIISDMKEMGLEPPMPKQVQIALNEWEKQIERKHNSTT